MPRCSVRSLVSLVFVALAGCQEAPGVGPIPINPVGSFGIIVTEFGDSVISGEARYLPTREGGSPVLTFELDGKAPGFSVTLTGHGLAATTEHWPIGAEEDRLQGFMERLVGGETERYEFIDGFTAFTLTSSGRLSGRITFRAIQVEGSQPGRVVDGTGNYSAVCEGAEGCPGSGQPG